MHILTISNLFPRPDQPARGIFNLQLFAALAELVRREDGSLETLVPVAEWRVGRHRKIERWQPPAGVAVGLNVRYRPYFYLPLVGRSTNAVFFRQALKAETELLSRADIIFATWLYPDGVAVANWAAFRGKRVGVMVQGSDILHLQSAIRRRQILRAMNRDVRIFCVWQGLADKLVKAGVRADKICVTPNGVDVKKFHYRPKDEARRKLSVISDQADLTRLVLFVGNLVAVKGCDRLIEAWIRFMRVDGARKQAWKLAIIGDGPQRPILEGRIRDEGLAATAVFMGRRPHAEIPFWMNWADVLCLPSRSEGHPNVVSEALASGLPVIAADVGACRELLAEEPEAIVLSEDAGFAGRLAEAMARFGERSVDREALSRRHSQRTWHTMAGEILRGIRI